MNANVMVVIGIGHDGPLGLSPEALTHIESARVLAGGRRHLDFFPHWQGEKVVLGGDVPAFVGTLQERYQREKTVVLASGDPLFYGIGRALLEAIPREDLVFLPQVSSVQLAFARIKETWHDASVISLHGRSTDALVVAIAARAPKIAVLTDARNHPTAIADLLRRNGVAEKYALWVCENLGGPDERIARHEPASMSDGSFSPLNVVILLRATQAPDDGAADLPLLGIPEAALLHPLTSTPSPLTPPAPLSHSGERGEQDSATCGHACTEEASANPQATSPSPLVGSSLAGSRSQPRAPRSLTLSPGWERGLGGEGAGGKGEGRGMITRREVRLLALCYLELRPGDVLWDVGAGSGSVSLEGARLSPRLQIFAVERDAAAFARLEANVEQLGAGVVRAVCAEAPEGLNQLPDPDAVFIGGSGGRLTEILDTVMERLKPGGRLVLNCITLENFCRGWERLRELDLEPEATSVQLAHSRPLGRLHSLEPENPIFILRVRKR